MKTLKILLRGLGGLCVFICVLCGICQWLFGFGGETAFWFFLTTMCIALITELFMGLVKINYDNYSTNTQRRTTYTKTSQSSSTTNYGINFNIKK